jgi:hypothetical protein
MYPVIYNRLFIAIGSDPQPGRIRGILVESATDFTEANFQEWAVTLQRTQRIVINIYNDKEEHLGGAETVVNLETVNMIIEAIDQANKVLEAIPEEQRNFKTAAQAFFSEHPEPFLFD